MKVLVSFENRVRPDSTGIYIVSAFKQLGHEVEHVLPEKIKHVRGGYDLYVKVDDGQRNTSWNPELHPSAYYCIDTHIETDWRLALARDGKFDQVSVVHSQGLNLLWGRSDVYWNPVGCDPEMHFIGLRAKVYDGCFIGNFHNGLGGPRRDMLDIFFKATPSIFFGNRMFKEMTEKYAQSRFVFNRSVNGDVNMRVFEALCSGSCLVTDRVADLGKLGLIDQVHYIGYSDGKELNDVTRKYLVETDLRENIAKNGHKFVLEHHTYAHRVKLMIEKANLHIKENENVYT